MATKSKSDRRVLWSIIALAVAGISLLYCSSIVFHWIDLETIRSSRAIAHLTRIIQGGFLS